MTPCLFVELRGSGRPYPPSSSSNGGHFSGGTDQWRGGARPGKPGPVNKLSVRQGAPHLAHVAQPTPIFHPWPGAAALPSAPPSGDGMLHYARFVHYPPGTRT